MQTFKYEVVDKNNNKISGLIEAKDKFEVIRNFQSKEYKIVHIEEYIDLSFDRIKSFQLGGIPLSEKVIFMKQFSTMISAGLPISSALETLTVQTSDSSLKKQLQKVLKEVQGGNSLYNSFKKSNVIFSDIQMNLLNAGESSGKLDEILQKITFDLERSKNFISKVRGALIYPSLIFFTTIVVMWVLMVYMMPSIANLFIELGAKDKTPLITQILINLSDLLNPTKGITPYLIVAIIVVLYILYHAYRNTVSGRYLTDMIYSKIPVFGKLYTQLDIAQFCRIFSMLLSSGVNISEAINITSGAVSSSVYKKAILDVIPEIEKGGTMADALQKSNIFPPVLIRMVDTGEKTGKLDSVLSQMAKFYEDEVDNMSSNLTKLLEPMVLLIVGIFVAILAVAVYLPIYQISQAFGN